MDKQAPAQGALYVISAPSGAGKTSLVKALLDITEGLTVSVSHTTRARRQGEEDGVHYHFVTTSQFEDLITKDEFLEHAKVFDNYYGTAVSSVNTILDSGQDLILEIDWQGARQVRVRFPQAIGIFILPPTQQALRERLSNRGQDSEDVIERRMKDAVTEISHYKEFDYLVVNDDFNVALQALACIITSQRQRLSHQMRVYAPILRELLT